MKIVRILFLVGCAAICMTGCKKSEQSGLSTIEQAYVKMEQNELEEALELYTNMLDQKETSGIYYLRGTTYVKDKNITQAFADFKEAVARDEGNLELRIAVYKHMMACQEETKAEELLEGALEAAEKEADALQKAEISWYQKNISQTITFLEEVTKKNGNFYNLKGLCELQSGNYEEALEAFSVGLSLGEEESRAELQYNKAIAYEYTGDFELAREQIEEYRRQYPNDGEAEREYQFLCTR